MRFLIIPACLLILISCGEPDKKPLEQKSETQHSEAFNREFDAMMRDYYALTEAFVNWDSNAVVLKTANLDATVRGLRLDDLKDTATLATAMGIRSSISANIIGLANSKDLTAKRHQLHYVTQNIYDLLRAAKYDEKKLYLQECPMAFNDTEAAQWLTDKGADSIRNPYLGLHHPKYGDAMVGCGENKAIIDFVTDKKEEQKPKENEKADEKHDSKTEKNNEKH